jgi:hypothetical protein
MVAQLKVEATFESKALRWYQHERKKATYSKHHFRKGGCIHLYVRQCLIV